MNALEIVQAIASEAGTGDLIGFVEDGCKSEYYNSYAFLIDDELFRDITFALVHEEGGSEGGGEDVERVIEVKQNGKLLGYVQIDGYYQSYNGTDWNEPRQFIEVFPVVRPTTYYIDPPNMTPEEMAQHGLK